MYLIYSGLALTGLLFYVGVGILGILAEDRADLDWHVLLGVFAGIYLCALHSVGMFHLIGSAKEIKDAAKAIPEFPEVLDAIRRSKKKIFPLATGSILSVIATVVLGGAIDRGYLPLSVHHVLVAGTLLLNLHTFLVEIGGIRDTALLMAIVDARTAEMASGKETTAQRVTEEGAGSVEVG